MSHNLRCVGATPIDEIRSNESSLIVDDGIAYTTIGKSLQIFSLRELPLVRRIATLDMQETIYGIVKKNNVLFLNTWMRGINMVDVETPSEPRLFDCLPYIGRTCGKLLALNNHLIVSWEREKIVGLIDITEERKPVLLHELLLKQDIADLVLIDNKIVVANDEDGIAILTIQDNKLELESRVLADTEFKPQHLYVGSRGLYAFGYGGDRDMYLLDKCNLNNILVELDGLPSSPDLVMDTDKETFLFHSHYTCTRIDQGYQSAPVFKQYFADADQRYYEVDEAQGDSLDEYCTCMDEPGSGYSLDNKLLTIQEKQFMVWEFPDGSVLTGARVTD